MAERFRRGSITWMASDSPSCAFSAVFEDDGESGYFYAYDRQSEAGILDAMQIYAVSDFPDLAELGRECEVDVRWSPDGLKAGLVINDQLQAIINFEIQIAYARSNEPPPTGAWAAPVRLPWKAELASLLLE